MDQYPYTYLRLSVTDQCNFNCFYCRPSLRNNFLKDSQMLSTDNILSIVSFLKDYGLRHVRLTGGEPLLRKDVASLIKRISSMGGLDCLSLTTNGLLLPRFSKALRESGVQKINISLDTLKKERFKKLTGCDGLRDILKSIDWAKRDKFTAVKLNCILIKGFNDDEVLDFVDLGQESGVEVRFIEYFPTTASCDGARFTHLPTDQVKKIIEEKRGILTPLGSDRHAGPARYFRLNDNSTRLGFISSVTEFFCGECNRLRLTSDGRLYPCLHSAYHVDLKKPAQENNPVALKASIDEVFFNKKLYNKFYCPRAVEMSQMGG